MKCKITLSAVMVILLASCTTYNKDFACGNIPDVGCSPTEQVFEKYEGKMVDYRRISSASENGQRVSKKKPKNKSSRQSAVAAIVEPASTGFSFIKPGDPILTKPNNIRILFFPWEDEDRDLHAGGYVYVRIGEPEWRMVKDENN